MRLTILYFDSHLLMELYFRMCSVLCYFMFVFDFVIYVKERVVIVACHFEYAVFVLGCVEVTKLLPDMSWYNLR